MKIPTRLFHRWPFIAFGILGSLVIIYVFVVRRETSSYLNNLIADNVVQLKTIFERIDSTCGIIDFEYEKNWINFLNVGTFLGSEVGPMNLRNSRNWEGPYLRDNPTIQEKEYQIVKVREGYAVMPGVGVRLSNGAVVGIDILVTPHTSV